MQLSEMIVRDGVKMKVPGLKRARQRRLLTQQGLADKARMSVVTVNLAEQGKRDLRVSTVRRLCEALSVTPEELLEERREAA